MRDTRQIAVLRSLFRTLHPVLTSGIKSGLAPAKRMLTGAYQQGAPAESTSETTDSTPGTPDQTNDKTNEKTKKDTPHPQPARAPAASPVGELSAPRARPQLPPLPRTLTDEHLVTELDNATRQYDLPAGQPSQPAARKPARSRRHYNRDTLLSLLEEAKVRIQVLETELELARGTEEHIPLLTEEWSDDLPSTYTRKPD